MIAIIPEYRIESGYVPGTIGRVSELHGTYYNDRWGFGLYFEAKVATELSEFLQRYDENSDGIWIATMNGRVEGSIMIDAIHTQSEGAKQFSFSRAQKASTACQNISAC